MLHNEVQGWHMLKEGFADTVSFVFLRGCEGEEEAAQLGRLKRLIRQRGGKRIHEVSLKSPTRASAILKMIYYCDYVSFYLAIVRGVDPTPVRTIQSLKRLTRPLT
jgi:glucose/mannose-6-phosphate isomerase